MEFISGILLISGGLYEKSSFRLSELKWWTLLNPFVKMSFLFPAAYSAARTFPSQEWDHSFNE